jgi:hypothetical protein
MFRYENNGSNLIVKNDLHQLSECVMLDLPQGCFTPDGTCNAIDLVECRFIYAFG